MYKFTTKRDSCQVTGVIRAQHEYLEYVPNENRLLKLKLKNGDKGIQFSYLIDLFVLTLNCMVHVYMRVLCE